MSMATCLRRLLALTAGSLVLWGLANCSGNNVEDQGPASRFSRLVLVMRTADPALPARQRASAAPVQSQQARPGDPTFATRFEVRVQAVDIHPPLQSSFPIPPDQPVELTGELFVPMGVARTISVVFFNAADVAIFEGQTTVDLRQDVVPVTVTLTPLFPRVTPPDDQKNREGDIVALQIVAIDRNAAPLKFDAAPLPPALTINANGLISGTLLFTAAGTYTVTVSASNGTLSGSAIFPWTVENVDRLPIVTSPGLQTNQEGETVALQIAASDPDSDPLTFTAFDLPLGLGIDATTGLISGTIGRRAASGSPYNVRVTATAGTGSGFNEFTWFVNAPSPLWVNHFSLLPGDPTVVSTSANSTTLGVGFSSGLTGLVITSSTTGEVDSFGGNKVVHMALDLPRNTVIKGVRVCYELTSSSSFISQIRLAQVEDPPSFALVLLDDGTNRTSLGPICVDSASTDIASEDGAVLLSLRVNFGNISDKIVIRALGLL